MTVDPHILTHAHYVCLSKMAEKEDPPSSFPPPSPSANRWSRHEIPLSRKEGEEVLAHRLRWPPPRKPAPVPRRRRLASQVKRYSCVYLSEFVGRACKIRREILEDGFLRISICF